MEMRSASTARAYVPEQLHDGRQEQGKSMSNTGLIMAPKVRARATDVPPVMAAATPPAQQQQYVPPQPPPQPAPGPVFRARASAGPEQAAPMVTARAMGQAAATVPQAPVQAPIQTAPMSLDEATSMLPGLKSAVETTDAALKSGAAKCVDVQAADLDLAKTYLAQMSQFVTAKVAGSTLTVQKNWLDAADKVVRCAIQAEKIAPNTGAYIALGVIVVGGIVALSV